MREIKLNSQKDTIDVTAKLIAEASRNPHNLTCIVCHKNPSAQIVIVVLTDTCQTGIMGICKDCLDVYTEEELRAEIQKGVRKVINEDSLGIHITHKEWIQ